MRFALLILCTTTLFSQVNTEKMRQEHRPKGFYHNINVIFGLNKGNEEFSKIEGGFRTDYISNSFNSMFIGNIEYVEGNNSVITNKGFLHLRTIFALNNYFDLELFTQSEYNRFISMRERYLGGTGIRLEPIDKYYKPDSSALISFHIGFGIMYEYENQGVASVGKIHRLIRGTNNINFLWQINKVFSISEIIYFQPDYGNLQDYRILNDFSLMFKIAKHFGFFTRLNYRYDSEPTEGVKEYDIQIENGITIEF